VWIFRKNAGKHEKEQMKYKFSKIIKPLLVDINYHPEEFSEQLDFICFLMSCRGA
jgi:hypothetical protein